MEGFLREFASYFPVWYTTRAAGLTSYILLFLSMVAGMIQSMKWLSPRYRSVLLTIHHTTGWFGLLFGMIHGFVLLYDQYIGYSFREILIPFTAHSETFGNGVGTIALYIMLVIVVSSDLIKLIGKKIWRSIHFLAFPGYLAALYHGITLGTDTSYGWAKLIYLITGGIVLMLVIIRSMFAKSEKKTTSISNKQTRSIS